MKAAAILVCLTICVSGVCRAQGSIQRYTEPNLPPSPLESLVEPPDEVLKAFVDGVKADPIYAFASELATDKVEPEVAKWSKDLGVPIEVRSLRFMKFILEDLKPEIKFGEKGRIWA